MRRRTIAATGPLLIALAACGGGGDSGEIPPFNLPFSIVIADFNGDGSSDLAVVTTFIAGPPPHPGFVSVILQTAGAFQTGMHFATGTDPVSVAAGDLNSDGKVDLVVANSTSGTISVLLQDPAAPAHFLSALTLATGGSPNGVAVGDLNGDGRLDIAVATSNTVMIFFQDVAHPGHFLAPVSLAIPGVAAAVVIGDLNGDGSPDLVVASSDGRGGSNKVSILLQDAVHPGTFLPAASFPTGVQPLSVAVGDLNGDGLLDVATGDYGGPSDGSGSGVSVLLQDSGHPGTLLPPTTYATDFRSWGIAIGDVNGDGKLDLVVANNVARTSNDGSVSVLWQNPANPGLFLPAINYPGAGHPTSVAIADLNGDGHPDIAVADGNGATVLFQNPTVPGRFFPRVEVGN